MPGNEKRGRKQMKFSFVIPTFNNKALLRQTLEALNHQVGFGRDDYEVIVADDGSTDRTGEFIQGCGRNYDLRYLYLERNEESSRSRTRNAGWRRATGVIIVFIDSDIVVKEDYLQELSRCFSLNGTIMVTGPRLMLDQPVTLEEVANKRIFKKYYFEPTRYERLEYRHFLYAIASYNANAILLPWTQVYGCNLAVPKISLEEVGGFDENFQEWGLEDLELGYSLYQKGVKLVYNSKLETLHQYHGERNDLVIATDKLEGYAKNVAYFVGKHPQALRMPPKIALKYLAGDLDIGKLRSFDIHPEVPDVAVDFQDGAKLAEVKEQILELLRSGTVKITVFDYVEHTDLDIWIQLLDFGKNPVRYFPMSRQIDVVAMARYIDAERARQRRLFRLGEVS
jgi:glycosyltransferase involved in cell wall biosynthesis